jgi:oxygen-independent coproporphyrinogen-3 oxidase
MYIHVPLCTDKCAYCDFFSVPRWTVASGVIEKMLSETIKLAHRLIDSAGSDTKVDTLFVGGGTPSCLSPQQLQFLFGGFSQLGCSEWTVESNPETLDDSFLDVCREAGVTRLSVGIQSLSSRHLRSLQRRATRRQALSAIQLLRKSWEGALNIDFITGIPGQTVSEIREDLSVLCEGWPDHVSMYQLTLEPGTPWESMVKASRITLNRSETDEKLWLTARDELMSRGYRQYEVSNFALPGKECIHNLHYWRLDPYAGAGPGAVSTLPAAWAARALKGIGLSEIGPEVVRLSAPKDLGAFLQGEQSLWGIQTELISSTDFLLECLMMGLRLSDGIPVATLQSRFGRGFLELFPGLWEEWSLRSLALPPGAFLRLTPEGLLLLDRLLGEVVDRLPEVAGSGLNVTWPP